MGYGFDDGPNCTHNVFYDYLASQNQKATMFYIGSNVFDFPLEAQRALADGHQICIRECSNVLFLFLFRRFYYTRVLIALHLIIDTWSHNYSELPCLRSSLMLL